MVGQHSVLQTNVTERINHETDQEAVTLKIDGWEELAGYVPFSMDVNVESRLEELTPTLIMNPPPEDEDEYIVENIVKKQFNTRLGQYEFLVKWKGYSAKHNTWELITNIPDAVLNKFEQEKQDFSARSGLCDRQTIKSKYNPNFISNT